MIQEINLKWLYSSGLLFAVASVLSVVFQFYFTLLLPIAAVILLLAVYYPQWLFFISVALVPLSVTVHDIGFGIGMHLPSEPVIILLMGVSALRILWDGFVSKEFLKHPLTIVIGLHLLWTFLTSISSSIPLVSFKYFLARLWFVLVYFYFASRLFEQELNFRRFLLLMLIPAGLVVTWIVTLHSTHGFSRDAVFSIIQPFFWIHGVYAAMVAWFAPVAWVLFLKGKSLELSPLIRSFMLYLCILFLVALVYSYTRAAWLSLAAAVTVYAIVSLKIDRKLLYLAVAGVLAVGLYFQGDIMLKLSRNKTGSNSKNMEKHLQSATNIKNDPSNLERLNRWSCAYRMFLDKPILGFGPGTYMFQYAPYQLSYQKTVISTNFATLGHAHSEFLGPLAESGLIGMLLWLLVFVLSIHYTLKLVYEGKSANSRTYALLILLGLTTYFVHGFLNSYFDYDKIAMPFWAFISMIVNLDIQNSKELV